MIMDIKTLQNPDGYTFDEGVAILAMCQASPGVVQHIMRTHNKGHLHSEIHKMLRMPGVMQLLKSKMPPVNETSDDNEEVKTTVAEQQQQPAQEPQEPSDNPEESSEKSEESSETSDDNEEVKTTVAEQQQQPAQEPQEPSDNPEESSEKSEESSEASDDNEEVKTMSDVRRHQNTRYEDMPNELTQDLWLKKQDKFRLQQQMHLKMKAVPEGEEHDEERAQYREAVVKLDDEIDKLWELIDTEIERFNAEKQRADNGAEQEPDSKPAPTFKESTYRAYISRKLAKPSLTDSDIVEVQHRVDEMLACGMKFSDELIAKMQAAGIRIG